MILIDTSVWIEYLRRTGNPQVKERVRQVIAEGKAVYSCPVYSELLAGARDEELADIEEALSYCQRLPFKPAYWDAAGRLYRELRKLGITVPHDDARIAVAASALGLPLLCRDRHFGIIQEKGGLPLKLEQLIS
jgi:predicted nucleic acid-binding protein